MAKESKELSYAARLLKTAGNEYAEVIEHSQFGHIDFYTDTGVPLFNAALSADITKGMPCGRVIQLAGPKGCGKTRLAVISARAFQKAHPDGIVMWFDSEFAVDDESLKRDGFDPKRTVYFPIDTVEDMTHQLKKILDQHNEAMKLDREGTPRLFIVVDSIGNLASRKEIADAESGSDKRDMTRQQKMKSMFRVLTMLIGITKTTMVLINHVYASVGAYIPTDVVAGGSGPAYMASITLILNKKKDRVEQKGDDGKNVKVQTGALIKLTNDKNRLAKEGAQTTLQLSFSHGFNPYYGLWEYALAAGIVVPKMKLKDKKSEELVPVKDRWLVPHIDASDGGFSTKELRGMATQLYNKEAMEKINEIVKQRFGYGTGEEPDFDEIDSEEGDEEGGE